MDTFLNVHINTEFYESLQSNKPLTSKAIKIFEEYYR